MSKTKWTVAILVALCYVIVLPSVAGAATVAERLAALEKRVTKLEAKVKAQQTEINRLKSSNVMKMNKYVAVTSTTSSNGLKGPRIVFTGANILVRNGTGWTESSNGLGNLIVGYNETVTGAVRSGSHNIVVGSRHSYSSYGSLIAGYRNKVSGRYSSITGGYDNAATGEFATVSAGRANKAGKLGSWIGGGQSRSASADYAAQTGDGLDTKVAAIQSSNVMKLNPHVTVYGGAINYLAGPHVIFSGANVHVRSGDWAGTANGLGNLVIGNNEVRSSPETERTGSHNLVIGGGHKYPSTGGIVAGQENTISGSSASVTAGYNNIASGDLSSVSGGWGNTASGYRSWVSGGSSNIASANWSSVSGGYMNQASGTWSSVTGGRGNTASGAQSTVSGGLDNNASGSWSTVSGGLERAASGDYNWAAGGLFQDF